jgi:Flp pilus assembly protein TadB
MMMWQGMYVFLSVSAVALFSFIAIAHWAEERRKEREAYYRYESLRRIAESPSENAAQVIRLLQDEDRRKQLSRREGIKIGGIINVAVGISVCIFLYNLLGPRSPYLAGLVPACIGAALLIYALALAPRPE